MYNKFLEPLLDTDPTKTITKAGIRARKIISPIFRFVIPFITPHSRLKVISKEKMPKRPIIFAATHGFREDVEHTIVMAGRQTYMLNGSTTVVLNSFDGITAWIAGMILVDRTNKECRKSAKEKMVLALKYGASIIIYPEGTWNKSPNQLMSGLFPGVYDVASKFKGEVLVAPIATYRSGKVSYGILGEAFDITQYEREEGLIILRDKLATMQYEIMEQYGHCKRADFPYGEDAEAYWKKHIDDLMAEVEFYDYDVELHTKYRPKGITEPKDAFAFLEDLIPSRENAFLLRG